MSYIFVYKPHLFLGLPIPGIFAPSRARVSPSAIWDLPHSIVARLATAMALLATAWQGSPSRSRLATTSQFSGDGYGSKMHDMCIIYIYCTYLWGWNLDSIFYVHMYIRINYRNIMYIIHIYIYTRYICILTIMHITKNIRWWSQLTSKIR